MSRYRISSALVLATFLTVPACGPSSERNAGSSAGGIGSGSTTGGGGMDVGKGATTGLGGAVEGTLGGAGGSVAAPDDGGAAGSGGVPTTPQPDADTGMDGTMPTGSGGMSSGDTPGTGGMTMPAGMGGMVALDAGPSTPPPAGYKFGAHPFKYPAGTIKPTGEQATLDAAVAAAYDKWKSSYVTAGCGGFVVKTTKGEMGELTGSVALGRGMIFAAMFAGHDTDAQKLFDGLYTVSRSQHSAYKGNEALVAYSVRTTCKPAADDGSTTDGDIEFAYALLLADKQWGSGGTIKYADEAKKTIASIKKFDMNPTLHIPLSGDWASLAGEAEKGWFTDTKSGNFFLGPFRSFAKAAADTFWTDTVGALQTLIASLQMQYSATAGLVPEYLDEQKPAKSGYAIATDKTHAGEYGGNAGVLPLRLAQDFLVSGDAKTKTVMDKLAGSLKKVAGDDPTKIVDGYTLAGMPFGGKGTLLFIAPLGAAAIFDGGNQAWLDAIWKQMTSTATTGMNSETDSTNLLAMLLVTGNWWAP